MRNFYFLVFILLSSSVLAQGTITGRVFDKKNSEPIEFATVFVQESGDGTITDSDGEFNIVDVKPGFYTVNISFLGYKDETVFELEVTATKPAVIDIGLEENATNLEEVVVKASPFKKTKESPVSLRSIGVTEIKRNPGGNRDISTVVQTLPGVTSTPSFRNDLIIRGGAPNENRFYLDDVEVPNINHFATQGASGGPTGLINVDFIREVDFYSGAFPANRPNALSSVFVFKQKDGRSDRIGATATVGASDIGVSLEGPINEQTTFLVSARRSYLQFLFDALELPFLPTYNDFQAKVKYRKGKNELYFLGLGAIDQFKLNLDANETESQQFLLNNLPVSPQWNYTNGLVYKRYGDRGFTTFVLSRNMLNNESYKYLNNDDSTEDNLILDYQSQEIENKARIEQNLTYGNKRISFGINYEFAKFNTNTFQRISTFGSGLIEIDYDSRFNLNKYGIFGQYGQDFIDGRLSLSAGFRIDGNDFNREMSNPLDQFSPRISASYDLTSKFSLNANAGIYYQLPTYTAMGYREAGKFVNKENGIRYIQSNHLVVGIEYNTNFSSRATLEGYYKQYLFTPFLVRDQIALANLGGDFGVIGNERIESTAGGEAYGIELLYQQRLYKGFYGIASYTFGYSKFENKDEELVASSWDARNIFNLAIGRRFAKNWEAGINWRFQSGLPTTPFDPNSNLVTSWNVNGRGIRDFDRLNTARANAFSAIDVRVDKKFYFKRFTLDVYMDLQNITANKTSNFELLLDRPLNQDGLPEGDPVIINPNDPIFAQRYLLKEIDTASGLVLPTLGLVIEI
ncbi:TonB-dependent receptor [Portibacter marinus]|uniref:TonB-dependent receptor n=1 Tax=Portibacter marinus TaxID=2898660 RepID=UPI001F2CC464|nr:TonB-dependent receptor [Portibacter marinus]